MVFTGINSPFTGTSYSSGATVFGFCYSPELNILVAVGIGSYVNNNQFAWSDDLGLTWTVGNKPFTAHSAWPTNVVWSSELGLFVATANSGIDGTGTPYQYATSTDGKTWVGHTSSMDTMDGIQWSAEQSKFVATATDSFNKPYILTSTNGTTWNTQSVPWTTAGDNLSSVDYSQSLNLWVAVGYTYSPRGIPNAKRVLTSPTGVTWTERSTPMDNSFGFASRVFWDSVSSRFYVCGGFSLDIDGNGIVLISSANGTSWVAESTTSDMVYLNGFCVTSNGTWIASGTNNYTARVWTSNNNGTTWSVHTEVAGNYEAWQPYQIPNSNPVLVPSNQPRYSTPYVTIYRSENLALIRL